jgi:protein-tyrosine phosphatase
MSAAAGHAFDFNWVAPGLAVGGCFPTGAAVRLARDHRIGAVIDVRAEACDDPAELAACGLKFLHLPTEDLLGLSQQMLDEGVDFAERARAERRRVLIHCQHGIGRSATLALCVLVKRGLTPLEALAQAKTARARVSPSQAQYEAWMAWLRRRAPAATLPTFHEFGCIAYQPAAS